MRRIWLALPAFLGAACIAAAIAIPAYLVPALRVVPLDLDITSDASTVAADGSAGNRYPATIFDRCSLSQPKAATLSANLTQQRRSVIIDPSDRRQATVQSAQTVEIQRTRDAAGKETEPTMAPANDERKCDDGLLNANIDRVSVNRKTSVPNGAVSSLQLEAVPEGGNIKDVSVDLPDRKGFQYKFGFGVKKRDYLYYDTTTRQDVTAKYVAEKTIDGVKTYEFVAQVPETDLSSLPNAQGEAALGTMLTQPASWWGISGRGVTAKDSVTMHRYASATRHVWVEPETGTIVDGKEDQSQYFKSPDQSQDTPAPIRNFKMDVLKGTFKWSDSTVSNQTTKAKGYIKELKLGGFWVPLILAIIGVALLALFAFLLIRGRRDGDGRDGDGSGGDNGAPDRVDDGTDLVEPDDGAATTVMPARDEAYDSGAYDVGNTPTSSFSGANPWERPTEQIPTVSRHAAADSADAPATDEFRPIDSARYGQYTRAYDSPAPADAETTSTPTDPTSESTRFRRSE